MISSQLDSDHINYMTRSRVPGQGVKKIQGRQQARKLPKKMTVNAKWLPLPRKVVQGPIGDRE